MPTTTITDFYKVGSDNNEINLKVDTENAQLSRTTVRLNKELVGHFDDSFNILLGKSQDIKGRVLYIDTTETDIDPNSDETSFTLELNGGPNSYINHRRQTIGPGGFIVYTAEIVLIP